MDRKTSEEKEENSCKNFEVKSRSFSILQCKIILNKDPAYERDSMSRN